LRFHDLRHTFGTRMIVKADIRRVQEWMGHADIQTTMRYLHYAPRHEDAALVAKAFAVETAGDELGRLRTSYLRRDLDRDRSSCGDRSVASASTRSAETTSRRPDVANRASHDDTEGRLGAQHPVRTV
jgi:Phage integrase family